MGIEVVMVPLVSLRNSMTTRPRAGSSRRLGLGIGDGAVAGGGGEPDIDLVSPGVSLFARTGVTGWTVISFDMAGLTANAAPYWRPEPRNPAPEQLKRG